MFEAGGIGESGAWGVAVGKEPTTPLVEAEAADVFVSGEAALAAGLGTNAGLAVALSAAAAAAAAVAAGKGLLVSAATGLLAKSSSVAIMSKPA